MGGYMPKNIIDTVKKQRTDLEKIKQETDIPSKPVTSKATGLPEPKPMVKSIDDLLKESKRLQEKYRTRK